MPVSQHISSASPNAVALALDPGLWLRGKGLVKLLSLVQVPGQRAQKASKRGMHVMTLVWPWLMYVPLQAGTLPLRPRG